MFNLTSLVQKIVFSLALLLFSNIQLFSQEQINGQIVDKETKEGLAFVTLVFNEGSKGISADINGNFEFKYSSSLKKITFSSIGYQSQTILIDEIKKQPFKIELERSSYNLNTVEILPGENPAHRIIKKAVENRKVNNPEESTDFFYESYNKLTFTTPIDSIDSELDSITAANILAPLENENDSTPISVALFIMESVAERNHFPPDFTQEVITQSRTSGLQTPFLSILGTQLQSFSLSEDFISIYGINYLSPISKGSINKYLFVLEDTLFKGKDTSFIISFRPRKNKYFQALSGVLSINTNQFAVENFTATQHDSTSFPIQIQQRYEFIQEKQWFPTQLNINIFFNSDVDGGFNIVGRGYTYIRNIELKARIDQKAIGNIALLTDPNITGQSNAFWDDIREVPLLKNEEISYNFIDSIGKEVNLDRYVLATKSLVRGNIPIGKMNLLLDKFLKFNRFESVRLGAGIETNEKLSKRFRLGGFGGYGFKDKAWKYGGHLRWVNDDAHQIETKLFYSKDIIGVGSTFFSKQDLTLATTNNVRNFINTEYDGIEQYGVSTSFRALRDFHFTFFGNQQRRTINSTYRFVDSEINSLQSNNYFLTEAGVDIRFSYKEKFGEVLGVILPVETKYPIVFAKYTKGFNNLLDGQFNYHRFDFSFFKATKTKGLGTTSLKIDAGFVDNVIPLTSLYAMQGVFDSSIYVASSYSFETMAPNEFYADKYLSVFFRHNFGSLLFKSPKFKPQFLLVSSFSLGTLDATERHQNFNFKTHELGYYESGIQVNNLLRIKYFYDGVYFGFGLGTYYRYGAYSEEAFEDNIAFKLTTSLSM